MANKRVKMRTQASGPTFHAGPGEIVTVDSVTADAWVNQGFAEFADPDEADKAPEKKIDPPQPSKADASPGDKK